MLYNIQALILNDIKKIVFLFISVVVNGVEPVLHLLMLSKMYIGRESKQNPAIVFISDCLIDDWFSTSCIDNYRWRNNIDVIIQISTKLLLNYRHQNAFREIQTKFHDEKTLQQIH